MQQLHDQLLDFLQLGLTRLLAQLELVFLLLVGEVAAKDLQPSMVGGLGPQARGHDQAIGNAGAPQQSAFAHVAIAYLDILSAAGVAVAELALDLDIPPRFQLGILGVAGVDFPLCIELAKVLSLLVAAANDAVAYRDAAPCLNPAPFDKAANHDVTANPDLHTRVDVAADD